MKRHAGLVAYGDSSDEEEEIEQMEVPAKKRKLPSLPTSLLPHIPQDNPRLHQGRIRTTPHVEGQFAAYVYVPLIIESQSPLSNLLRKVFDFAKAAVPALHPIGLHDNPDDSGGANNKGRAQGSHHELHISLTRPVYLRAYQREDLRRAVKGLAQSHSAFMASFASFSELTNDERTRTFLTLEVGAGYAEFKSLSDALIPTLRSIRQKEFYADARFHASIAWALIDRPSTAAKSDIAAPTSSPAQMPESSASADLETQMSTPNPGLDVSPTFPTIPRFPLTLIPALNNEFIDSLISRQVGRFEVDEVCIRIGKDVHKWPLRSS